MPTVLITGATGLLGRAIADAFRAADWRTIGTGLSRADGKTIIKLDILDRNALKALVEDQKPDLIVHSAAERCPDAVAADPDRAKLLNVDATAAIAALATSHGIPVLYISTDYVFPGVPGEAPYDESATPRATNLYGQLKLDGEKAVLQASGQRNGINLGAVLRVPVLYGKVDANVGNSESAVNVLIDKVRDSAAGKQVKMDHWARRYPTNVEDIGNAIVKIAIKWLDIIRKAGATAEQPAQNFPQTLHFSANECLTKYEMCQIFSAILGLDVSSMEADEAGGSGGGVQRPYDTRLNTTELEKLVGESLSTVSFKKWWECELRPKQ